MRTRTNPILFFVFLLLLVVLLAPAWAQTTVPGPRGDIFLDDPVDPAQTSLGSSWLWTYPADAQPPQIANQPFIASVKLTLTPTSGTGTRIVTLPRAQVTRETTAAACTPNAAPCLRAADVPLPAGAFNVTLNFVSGAGVEGPASTPIPFTGSYRAPTAPRGQRISPAS